nr:hypothetical protein [Tanacetum cinerariifolium]
MEGNKSIQRLDEQRNLYKALVEAYDADKTIVDTYEESSILKRRREEDDDQEGHSAGSDRGSKRRREGGEHASASTPSEPTTRSAGRSTTGTQSRHLSASESAFAEEPMQTTCQIEEPSHSVFKTAAQGNAQSWISALAKQTDAHSSFNELLDTPIDFSNFIMNRLGVDTLTHELLAGDFKRLRLQDIKDMLLLLIQGKLSNLTVEERFAFNVSLRMFTRSIVIQRRMEDLQLGVESYQKRLNLTKPDTYRSDLKRREAYTAYWNLRGFIYQNRDKKNSYQKRLNLTKPNTCRLDLRRREAYMAHSNPRGFIYQNKDKKNRLMRIDELHKFSDGTLNDVRNALDDRLKGIRIQ